MSQKQKKNKPVYKASLIHEGVLYEMVYDREEESTRFAYLSEQEITYTSEIESKGITVQPFPPVNDLLENSAVLLPKEPVEYGSEAALLREIQEFIHTYLEVSEFFERMTPYYVLFSWMHDKYKELPYLRAIGDYGSGKSRFLKVIGSVCYRPMFTSGATTPAPVFRIIDQFQGTIVLDEADMRYSDTNNEIVKILNSGFQQGNPVLRCSGDDYEVKAYKVYGPKIVATRFKFKDQALESRFLIEQMDGVLTRKDIPLNLDDEFDRKALEIRNKCLMWRLRNYHRTFLPSKTHDGTIEPRLNQIVAPLLSIIEDEEVKKEVRSFIKQHSSNLRADRGMSFETPILEIVIDFMRDESNMDVTMKMIADIYNIRMDGGERDLSPRKMGSIIREKFRLNTVKTRNGYILDRDSYNKNIERLCAKYGMPDAHVNIVNDVGEDGDDFKKELRDMGLMYEMPEL